MEVVLYVTGALSLVVGLVGLLLPGIPGSPLLLGGAALIAWAGGFARVGWPTLAIEAAIAALIFSADYVAGALGAKAFGASRWAVVGAAVGLAVGIFFGLPGIILGPAVGACGFELAKDPSISRAAKAGAGVLLGFLVGSVVKVALAFVFLGVLAIALIT